VGEIEGAGVGEIEGVGIGEIEGVWVYVGEVEEVGVDVGEVEWVLERLSSGFLVKNSCLKSCQGQSGFIF
jgi:hypothetical protein